MSNVKRAAVFTGTNEGRILCEKLCEKQIPVTAFVGADYGDEMLTAHQYLTIMKGYWTKEGMRCILGSYSIVVDATHPYERQVTEDIREVSKELGLPHLRVLREKTNSEYGIYVGSTDEAARYLNEHEGNALLMVNSREMETFNKVIHYRERLTVITHPTIDSILACNMAGFMGKQIIALEEVISSDLTRAMLQNLHANYLVMKEAEEPNGFIELVKGTKQAGAQLIIIQRSTTERGTSVEETVKLTLQFLSIS